MSRMNVSDQKSYSTFFQQGTRFQSMQWVPVTAEALDPLAPNFLFPNPAGAINLKMPTSNADRKGLVFVFCNLSGNVITLQTDGGAGFTTAITVAANGATRVVCTGNATQALGWVVW